MKKNISLLVGLLIPVFLVVIIALFVYIPRVLLKPTTNFVYSVGEQLSPAYGDSYSVENGFLVKNFFENTYPNPKYKPAYPKVYLYLYDAKQDKSRQVTFEEARSFQVSSNQESPDGFYFLKNSDYYGGGIFEIFGSSNNNSGVYLKKGNLTKKINITTGGNDGYVNLYSIKFIGWVK